jgi:hypothetical protein
MGVREREIEAYFVKRVREAGGLQRKFVSPGHRGVLDRIVGFQYGRFALVEVKATGEAPRAEQIREMVRWNSMGFAVWVIDSKEGVDKFIQEMTK